MTKKYSIVITVLFCLFIGGISLVSLLLPDVSFSPLENRYLQSPPKLSLETLEDGSFMEDAEDYVSDHIVGRDFWVALKAWGERVSGKQENNDVYFGGEGQQTLFAQYTKPSDLAQRVDYVNQLGANVDVPVYFALIPDKSFVWADRLPDNAPLVDDGSTIRDAQALVSGDVNFIDLSSALSGDNVFYRTDHHWSTMGAYQGYVALMNAMNGAYTQLDSEPTLVSDTFYGTTWSSSGAGWVRPDEMYTLVPEGGLTGNTTVTRYPSGQPEEGTFYDLYKLEVKDKYSMFLGGNQGLCVIKNPDAQGGKLLVIRDSYADSLAPFLSLDYQEVHLFDLRYNLMSLKQYVVDNDIDQVLVLYSNSNFSTDSNLALLGY